MSGPVTDGGYTPGDRVRENWSGIVGVVVDVHDGCCTVEWPSGRRRLVSNILLVPVGNV